LDKPAFGLDLKVSADGRYTLIERASRKEICKKVIDKAHKASFSDAFFATQLL
jgi:hypothetical protein